jgi:NADH-quinone oxidoreductase subunit L
LIPVLPLMAAGLSAVTKRSGRALAASLAIGAMSLALVLACVAFAQAVLHPARQYVNFPWMQMGNSWLKLGWVLDPLSAVMLLMVSLVGLLIFIYSLGYMAHDENFTRFFCFLSLFAAAMLGVVIANSLLLLFICWELVGLTSYLLIGFWYHKPSAAAAARKAFITTRIGDLALLLGMVWLYARSGTLLFYDGGNGCLEQSGLARLAARATGLGLAASAGIGLLIFCGAIGKSGQVPLHVWLPDAMEGPTPVSALIHAATMVAAGVFLVARVYPIMTPCLPVVAWVGAITAVFAASIAVAQTDIKRILAYSTVSQLGFMMLGLGVGGVAVGMFHLVTHAFFKALLFLGAGSVIHGCRSEQDIRRLGGLRRFMPITFATYAVGMLALSGFPLLFSGFWSKDPILEAARGWSASQGPFYLGLCGALLTAFYMTRQVFYVFYGTWRGHPAREDPHESPPLMTVPLMVLAVCSVLLGFVGTPAWPWFQAFLEERRAGFDLSGIAQPQMLGLMGLSSLLVLAGMALGYWLYGRKPPAGAGELDALERVQPDLFGLLRNKYFVDEIYEWAFVSFTGRSAQFCDWLDEWVCRGLVELVSYAALGLSWADRFLDEYVVNLGFDRLCRSLRQGGGLLSRLQDGRVQHYLRIMGVALASLILLLIWGWRLL